MKKQILLTRGQFKKAVFARDKNACVICSAPAHAAHHIIDRSLFHDGGYYVDNGASVCEECHLKAEMTSISPKTLRDACGIQEVVLPEQCHPGESYDKWLNIILPNKMRLKGEKFFEDNVQKMLSLGGFLGDFTNEIKYPRTFHVPWSRGISSDDKVHSDMSFFHGKRVVITRKYDGENSSLYRDCFHAKSIDSRHHDSQTWIKNFWAQIKYEIPEGWRVCVENLYALHSIAYEDLESYCAGFSIWNEKNECLSWDDTMMWFELLGVPAVEVIYDGIYDEKAIKALYKDSDWAIHEGWVMRVADSFRYCDFRMCVAKFVREGHVQTDEHWKSKLVVPNKLKSK